MMIVIGPEEPSLHHGIENLITIHHDPVSCIMYLIMYHVIIIVMLLCPVVLEFDYLITTRINGSINRHFINYCSSCTDLILLAFGF